MIKMINMPILIRIDEVEGELATFVLEPSNPDDGYMLKTSFAIDDRLKSMRAKGHIESLDVGQVIPVYANININQELHNNDLVNEISIELTGYPSGDSINDFEAMKGAALTEDSLMSMLHQKRNQHSAKAIVVNGNDLMQSWAHLYRDGDLNHISLNEINKIIEEDYVSGTFDEFIFSDEKQMTASLTVLKGLFDSDPYTIYEIITDHNKINQVLHNVYDVLSDRVQLTSNHNPRRGM